MKGGVAREVAGLFGVQGVYIDGLGEFPVRNKPFTLNTFLLFLFFFVLAVPYLATLLLVSATCLAESSLEAGQEAQKVSLAHEAIRSAMVRHEMQLASRSWRMLVWWHRQMRWRWLWALHNFLGCWGDFCNMRGGGALCIGV